MRIRIKRFLALIIFPGLLLASLAAVALAAPTFSEVTGPANPFDGVDVGADSSPMLADLDGDGDLDAVIGEGEGVIYFYRNDGTPAAPSFSQVAGAGNPFDGVDVGADSIPTLADLDGDGDLDLFIGELDGNINFYRNTGSVISPTFSLVTGSANPFNGVDVGGWSAPALADLDGDGDLDAFIGELDGTINFYRNTGKVTVPHFSEVTGAANPFDGVDVGLFSAPTLVDLDGDGDLDAVIGEYNGNIHFYRNDGTPTVPSFSEVTGPGQPFDGANVGLYSVPALANLDGDGDLDAFIGEEDGVINFYRNAPPEMAVAGNSQAIPDGDTSPAAADDTDFGVVILAGAASRTFTISNSGVGNLTLTGTPVVSLTGPAALDFSLVVSPTTPIGPNVAASFQLSFTPSVSGMRLATVTIANTDSDENPYDFAIQGRGVIASYTSYLPVIPENAEP